MNNFLDKLKKQINSIKKRVEALRKSDTFVFPIFTDLHYEGEGTERLDKLCLALELITREIKCDMVVNLGDNVGMLGRNHHILNDDLKVLMTDMLDRIYDSINCPMLCANGNHDAIGTDFFDAHFWNGVVKGKYGNTNALYGDGAYYYVDYAHINTRFVVLSVPYGSDLNAEHPTPLWAFGDKQLKWLNDIALDVKGNVIILMHVPFYYEDRDYTGRMLEVWNGKSAATSYRTDLCGRIEDLDKAVDIINEYNGKPDTNLVACFSGHTHADSIRTPYEEFELKQGSYTNPLPCHQIVTTGAFVPDKTHTEYGVSVDIALWTPSENKIDIVRVGDGNDRSI